MMKIVTSRVYPPIPTRDHDWCAHYDGEEEAGNYGWGRTEAEAIADFNENCREDHDERLSLGGTPTSRLVASGPNTQRLGRTTPEFTKVKNSFLQSLNLKEIDFTGIEERIYGHFDHSGDDPDNT